MKTSCLINNFNYARYLSAAVDSAFAQTLAFDEVIVVDDCSIDDSVAVLANLKLTHPRLQIVTHPSNRGQLAAFESGIGLATGDVVFFLDADDVYAPHYLAEATRLYAAEKDCDFVFCNHQMFETALVFPTASDEGSKPIVTDLGRSVLRTSISAHIRFVGNTTSCLSMKRKIASALLPYPWPDDWVTRADEVLVVGASMSGARKYHIEAELVGYRVHDSNFFLNNSRWSEPDGQFSYLVFRLRLIAWLKARFGITRDIEKLAYLEFKTIAQPSLAMLLNYIDIVWRHGVPRGTSRVRSILGMAKGYYTSRLSSRRSGK